MRDIIKSPESLMPHLPEWIKELTAEEQQAYVRLFAVMRQKQENPDK